MLFFFFKGKSDITVKVIKVKSEILWRPFSQTWDKYSFLWSNVEYSETDQWSGHSGQEVTEALHECGSLKNYEGSAGKLGRDKDIVILLSMPTKRRHHICFEYYQVSSGVVCLESWLWKSFIF